MSATMCSSRSGPSVREAEPAKSRRRMEGIGQGRAPGQIRLVGLIVAVKVHSPTLTALRLGNGKRRQGNAHLGTPEPLALIDMHGRLKTAAPGEVLVGRVDEDIQLFTIGCQ